MESHGNHDPLVDYDDDNISSTEKNTQETSPVDVVTERAMDVAELFYVRDTSTSQSTIAVVPVQGNKDVPIPQYLDILMFKLVNGVHTVQERSGERQRVMTIGTELRNAPDTRRSGSINDDALPTSVPIATGDPMAVTRSQPAQLRCQQQHQRQKEGQEREEKEVNEDANVMRPAQSEPRRQTIQIGTRRFEALVSFYEVSTSDFKRILLIPWFKRTAVLADAEVELSSMYLYT